MNLRVGRKRGKNVTCQNLEQCI